MQMIEIKKLSRVARRLESGAKTLGAGEPELSQL